MKKITSTSFAATLLLVAIHPLWAQGTVSKTTGKQIATSRLLTKDELRGCMTRQEDIKAKSATLDQLKVTLSREKLELNPANEELQRLREDVGKFSELIKQINSSVRDHALLIEQWNIDMKEAEDSPMRSAERRKKELQGERVILVARNNELLAQRDKTFALYEMAVEKFNARGKALESGIKDWNHRNELTADEADKLLELRDAYLADCGGRRFKEEDEAAIKLGK